MKKRLLIALLATTMVLGSMPNLAFGANDITVTVDGKKITFDQPPEIIDDRVMVPIRAVAEELGWEVTYNSQLKQADFFYKVGEWNTGGSILNQGYFTTIQLQDVNPWFNQPKANTIKCSAHGVLADIKNDDLIAKAIVENGRTLLGIRDIANGLYADINWDAKTRTVSVKSNKVETFPEYNTVLAYIADMNKISKERQDKNAEEEQKKAEEKKKAEEEQKKKIEEANRPYTDEEYRKVAEEVIELCNKERTKIGLSQVTINEDLMELASWRAEEAYKYYEKTGVLTHMSQKYGVEHYELAKKVGIDCVWAGENALMAGDNKPSAQSIFNQWLSSPPHKAWILNKDVKEIGVGGYDESWTLWQIW